MTFIPDVFLDTSSKISDTERRGGAWTCYETYETVRDDRGDWWLEAPRRGNRAHEYSPLIEHRALFHEFARFWEVNHRHHLSGGSREAARVAREWAEKYGVLGTRARGGFAQGYGIKQMSGDQRREKVEDFFEEAKLAYVALTLYEAARDAGEPGAVGENARTRIERMDQGGAFRPSGVASREMETRLWGLNEAAHITQEKLSDYCSPAIYREGDRFVRGFGFENLLGAMWLQMFWALTGDEGPRCKNPDCRNPMPLTRTEGRGRPIEYCDKRCANRGRYLLKTKDERRAVRRAAAAS